MSSGMKAVFVVFALLTLICCGGVFFSISSTIGNRSSRARESGDRYVKQITATWSVDALLSGATDDYKGQFPRSEFQDLFTGYEKTIGTFVRGKSTTRMGKSESQKPGVEEVVAYENEATFTKGKALVKLELAYIKGKWKINLFRIDPPN